MVKLLQRWRCCAVPLGSELRAVLRRNNSWVNDYNRWILLHHRANMDLQFICNPHGTAMYACMYSSKAEAPDSQVIQKQVLKMLAKEESAGLHEMTGKNCFVPRCLSLVQEKSPHKKLLGTSWDFPSFYVPGMLWRLMFCPLGVDKGCSIQFLKLSSRRGFHFCC